MKKSVIKIHSMWLTLALFVSMLFFAAPEQVAAAPGNMAFTTQTLPSTAGAVMVNGSDVTDIVVANDSLTVYAINGAAATGAVYRSTDAGQTFTLTTAPAAVTLTDIAVALDNPGAIAVTDGDTFYISNDGGTTWVILPALPAASAGATIMDVAVGPARDGTLLGRDYAIAVADPNAGATNTAGSQGDVLTIGGTTTWVSAGAASGITGANDYLAVAFSLSFVSDRVVVAVGSSATFAKLQLINTDTTTVVQTTTFGSTTIDYDGIAPTGTDFVNADIALLSGWEPSTGSEQRTYVTIAAAATFTDNDVYRIDAGAFRALDAGTAPYKSVTYAGNIDSGTLIAGRSNSNTVLFSTDPQVSLPTWVTCKKSADLATNNDTVVRVASDFATTSRVFAGTTGAESAFNVSNNGAISFDAESLIDNGVANNVVAIQSIEPTPDGKYLFMATDDGTHLSLWKSSTPISTATWSRVYVVAGTTGLVKLNPGWASTPVIYFADIIAGGNIYRLNDPGDVFATVSVPTGFTLTALAVENATTVYIGNTAGNVHKSTTSGGSWDEAKAANAGAITSLYSARAGHLLVGGTGASSYSTDGGDTFNRIDTGLIAGVGYQVIADDNYGNNKTIYAGGNNAAASNILRFIIGESTVWETLGNPTAAPIVGLSMESGVIYGMSAAACDRNLDPRTTIGTVSLTWDTLTSGAPAAIANFATAPGSNALYAANAVITLWAYNDLFATTKPVLTSPGDGSPIGVDPVTGRADLVNMVWNPVGTGTGAGNRVDMQIKEKGESWVADIANNNQVVNPSAPSVTMAGVGATWIYAMRANTEYEWRVRFDGAVSGEVARTPWSDPFTLKVRGGGTVVIQPHAGPVILGPQGGATTGLTPGISWAPLPEVTKYQVILATDPGLKNRVAGTPVLVAYTAWQPKEPLEWDTTYFFGIMAVQPMATPQSIGTFSTLAKPVTLSLPPSPPVVVDEQPALPPIVIDIPLPPPPASISPALIWAIVFIVAVLVIALIVLIVITGRPGSTVKLNHMELRGKIKLKPVTGNKEDVVMGLFALILGLFGGACAIMGIITAIGVVPFIGNVFSATDYLGYPMFWLTLAIVLFLAAIAINLRRRNEYD